jgi:template-activating factor I
VQRSFDAKKISILDQRSEEIAKIPLFWVTAIGNHPFTDPDAFVKDREVLAYLLSIELEDNLDDNGSYSLTFRFDCDTNPFFSNAELVRKVTILDDQTEAVSVTPILWAPKKQPSHAKSFFTWFSSATCTPLEDDFGEVLRRDLWQNPYPYYLNLAPRDPELEQNK